jgi:catechol 2,3-dioxygenase
VQVSAQVLGPAFDVDASVDEDVGAVSHVEREEWLAQLQHMQEIGQEVAVRGNHGMTHSAYIVDPDGHGIEVLYDLPPDVWEGDVNAALNHFEPLPTSGPEALEDDTNYVRFVVDT